MPEQSLIYWDANVFLHYLNGDPEKIPILEAIFADVQKKQSRIVTSVLSKVEVAWVATEKVNRVLNPDEEKKIDDLWNDSSVIEIIDFHDEITHIARSILRRSMARGWKIKHNDAIHLASAEWVGAAVMHTFDNRLNKYKELIGLDIVEPSVLQPRLI